MPSTNHTGYLNLTQYLGTDVTSWLEDYNSDMRKIDQGVQNNHTEIADAMTDIGSNTKNIATNTGAITNLTQDVSGVTTEVGTLKNQVTNQSGQLANLTTQMGTANTNISNLQSSYAEINDQVSENTTNIATIGNNMWKNTYIPLSLRFAELAGTGFSGVKFHATRGLYIIYYRVSFQYTLTDEKILIGTYNDFNIPSGYYIGNIGRATNDKGGGSGTLDIARLTHSFGVYTEGEQDITILPAYLESGKHNTNYQNTTAYNLNKDWSLLENDVKIFAVSGTPSALN